MKAPLNLTLSNPNNFDLKVTRPGRRGRGGYEPSGLQRYAELRDHADPRRSVPDHVPAGQTRTLTQLGVADGDKPQVEMLNLPSNQDACKSATITLDYGGSARK